MNKGKETASKASKGDAQIILHIEAGQASPKPPVGPALGAKKIPIMPFCTAFNNMTKGKSGLYKVVINVKPGGQYTMDISHTEITSNLIKRLCGLSKGGSMPGREILTTITKEKVREIALAKRPDLQVASEEAAIRTIEGTLRSMSIKVQG